MFSRGRRRNHASFIVLNVIMGRPKEAKEVPAATRAAMAALVKAGLTNGRVSDAIAVTIGTVSTIAARVRRGESASPLRKQGRLRLVDARGVRHLQLVVFRSRSFTLEQLTAEYNAGMPRQVS